MNNETSMNRSIPRQLLFLVICVVAMALVACTPKGSSEEENTSKEGASAESEGAEGNEAGEEAAGEQSEDESTAGTDETPEPTGDEAAGDEATAEKADDGERIPAGETRHYGGDFTIEDAPMSVESALAKVDELAGKPVKVEGEVKTACRKKGCWMQIVTHSEGAEPLRVTFKDYGFFVPKHADGSHAVMEGEFIKETMTEAMRKHLAEDANKSQEEIDAIEGDVDIVKFVATAVDLTGPDAQ